ncbi:PhzF family phenazine biosynthesis protein [Streptomyces tubbatahanensis]|uniref:PhzF family phenazine biosynthesis protein n=1 Tax=Streptomyces tubbatahanensis TaxID=2923272 RepID=A0ABY3XMZ8_9ACTN|nr:PhzF family phenazine biosynthesis protein [Streptomyces tubbatahanensis]UNS95764.1 PhzF family phenazine biosynthesis protein [Streptomyces tubbatahanensis]
MRIRTVDAFTAHAYAGNPAAVVLLDAEAPRAFPADASLQALAAEMNLAETAFAHPLADDPEADWALRWFTPTTEVDMCGHATLATAHLLAEDGVLPEGGRVRFRTRSGVLSASREADSLTLDFPTATLTEVCVPDGAAEAFGAPVVAAWDTGALGMLVLEIADEATLRGLAPDLAAVSALPSPAVLLTAAAAPPAREDAHERPYDFVSRMFAPAQGVPEDPVTGSAHTALAPLWSQRLGRAELTGLQVSRRTGYVRTTLRGARTLLGGSAVTVLDATLHAPL